MLRFLARLSQNLKTWAAFLSLVSKVGGRMDAAAALRLITRAASDGVITRPEANDLLDALGVTDPATNPNKTKSTPGSSK